MCSDPIYLAMLLVCEQVLVCKCLEGAPVIRPDCWPWLLGRRVGRERTGKGKFDFCFFVSDLFADMANIILKIVCHCWT